MTDDLADRIVMAALECAAEKGWRRLTIEEIRTAAGVSQADMARHAPSKAAILTGFVRMVDRAVLAGGPVGAEESVRDRLFDLMMRRFDVLSEHREGVRAVLKDLRADPGAALLQGPQLERSMAHMLEAAGVTTSGLAGALRVRALVLIHLLVLRVWETDETPDLARTMKALDERLRQAEQMENSFGGMLCRRKARREPPQEEAA